MNEITKTWNTVSGSVVIAKGQLITEKTNYSDGWNVQVDCCEIRIDVTVDGVSQGDDIVALNTTQLDGLKAKGHTQFTSRVGKLVLTDEQVKMIHGIREELENAPEWQAKETKIRNNQKDTAKLEQRGAGWCNSCQSYCHGDCQ